jgi:hypothetical protein
MGWILPYVSGKGIEVLLRARFLLGLKEVFEA